LPDRDGAGSMSGARACTVKEASSDFCNLTAPWVHANPPAKVTSAIACYTNAGVPTSADFLISDNSAV
jgi:hypothetical protein